MAGWLSSGTQSSIVADEAAANLGPIDTAPGVFDGVVSATGQGFMRGGAAAAQTIHLAGAVVPMAIDAFLGNEMGKGPSLTESWFRAMDDLDADAIQHWTPDEHSVGLAGRVVGGIAEFAIPLLAGGGNPLATAITTSAQATATTGADLSRSGATAEEAGGVAAVQGLANLVGVGIATRGTTALRRAAFGAGSNVAVNVPADAASAAILDDGKLAGRYDPFNVEARAIDLVVGALFGAMTKADAPPKTADLDAALTLQQRKYAQTDTAPGRIETAAEARAHLDTLDDVTRKVVEGRQLDGTEGQRVTVRPDPELAKPAEAARSVLDEQIAAAKVAGLADDGVRADAGQPVSVMPDPMATDPDVAVLRKVADDNPDMPVALVDDPNNPGQARRVTVRDALDEIDAEAKANDELASGMRAAINCFLNGGA